MGLIALAGVLAGCDAAPVTEAILITSNPSGATCTMDRDGVRLGAVPATPGSIAFPAIGGALHVTCSKPGYITSREDKTPGYSPDGGYIGPGGLLFLAVKAAAPPPPKSDWHYPAEIHVELAEVGASGTPQPLSGLRLR
jgi:hypothetical protein